MFCKIKYVFIKFVQIILKYSTHHLIVMIDTEFQGSQEKMTYITIGKIDLNGITLNFSSKVIGK